VILKATHFNAALHPLRSADITEHAKAAGLLNGQEETVDLTSAIDLDDLTEEQLNEAMTNE
jgi:hypothetical protein